MWRCWALVLAVLGGVCALPAPPTYPQALTQALDAFNQRPEVQNVFRLLSADPEPAPGVDLRTLRTLNFTLMETECSRSPLIDPDDCDFKENGAIKECWGAVQLLQNVPEIDLRCSDVSSDPVLIQRGRFGRFLGRIRRIRPPRIKVKVKAEAEVRFG